MSVCGHHTKLLAVLFPQTPSAGALQSDVLWHCALGNLDTHLTVVFKQRQRQSLVHRHYLIHPSRAHSGFLSVSHGTLSEMTRGWLICLIPLHCTLTAAPCSQHHKKPVFSSQYFHVWD